jgi:tRNA pseudouridine65 synthase
MVSESDDDAEPSADIRPDEKAGGAPDGEPPPPIEVLHLDEDLVVACKPSGLAVHRGPMSGADETFLLQRLRTQIERHLYPVQRLDRPTSGVIAFGLSRRSAARLQDRLQADDARKEYLVLARGTTAEEFVCDRPLSNKSDEPVEARTTFTRLATFARCSLLRARLHTGRRHQIRRHLAHAAHHAIGDTTYGKGRINQWFRDQYGLPRLFLHAARLRIRHPRTDEILDLTARLPDDLRAFLARIPDVEADLLQEL